MATNPHQRQQSARLSSAPAPANKAKQLQLHFELQPVPSAYHRSLQSLPSTKPKTTTTEPG
ncbi:hypothetical protein [Ferrimonas senticii]|uniref:hypothetical protein n=1 Tax=Ferrimonas senticii TaxID=394566 RepID=UPI00041DFDB3|nr:hypothetical protein [Ferrimonas senticii]